MLQHNQKSYLPAFGSGLIGLFFILVLHNKISYTLIPVLLSVFGLVLFGFTYRSKRVALSRSDKWLIAGFLGYLLVSALSVLFHQGRLRELDLPSKLLILLPILAIFTRIYIKPRWIVFSIVIAALLAGSIGIVRFFFVPTYILFPEHMSLQSGGILMSLSLFCIGSSLYFQQQKLYIWQLLSLCASSVSLISCLLNQSRGSLVLAPFLLIFIIVVYRHLISKWFIAALLAIVLLGSSLAGDIVLKRWKLVEYDIIQYIENNNGDTSNGARLDMWKSSLIGIQEKPLLGWGVEGVKELRNIHLQQGKISATAADFVNPHNQYLHDTTTKGILGLISLLMLFLVPIFIFWKGLKAAAKGSLTQLWSVLGIVHIFSVMGYCLTQSFLSHNSGMMFFAFVTLIFYGLQKNSQSAPLVEDKAC